MMSSWSKRMEELKDMSEKQEARANYYDTKLHTIIAAYFIWERVFFFFISQKTNNNSSSSSISCNNNGNNLWVIVALSCLCSLVYMLLFIDTALVLYRTEHQLNLILQTQAQLYGQIKREAAAHAADNNINPSRIMEMEAGDHDQPLEEELVLIINSNNSALLFTRSRERKFYMYTIFCALVGVAALELYVCKSMLCN